MEQTHGGKIFLMLLEDILNFQKLEFKVVRDQKIHISQLLEKSRLLYLSVATK